MAGKNLKQTAYEKIKENIISCRYEPDSVMNEAILCQELNMSRTPVRDALGRLEMDGFLTILPKKGIRISQITLLDVNSVFESRILIEPYIIRNYGLSIPGQVLEQLLEMIRKEKEAIGHQTEESNYWDDEFHRSLCSCCTNHYFLKLLDEIQSQNKRVRVVTARNNDTRLEETVLEHQQIISRLQEGKADQAADLMVEHLQKARQTFFLNYKIVPNVPL